VQAVSRVLLADGLYYGKDLYEYQKMSTDGITMMIKQAMDNEELDPSVDVELAVIVMQTWTNAISSYILKEGLKQRDIMKWLRSAKTQERIDKFLYVMEYGLRKTESQFSTSV
jgi:F420-0:gamma-glutamyl ligase-like protein